MRFLSLFLLLCAAPFCFMFAFEGGWLDNYVDETRLPADPFIRAELSRTTNGADLSAHVERALAAGAADDAAMYAGIADYMGVALTPAAQAALRAEQTQTALTIRSVQSFARGFATGEGTDTASVTGAFASDITVIGDVRDIGSEGARLAMGENYSPLILGLSAVGLAASTATMASGGLALPVRAGVSTLKLARRTGALTARFARELTGLVADAVDLPGLTKTLRTTKLTDPAAARRVVADYSAGIARSPLVAVLDDAAALERNVGTADAVRLMAHVETSADLGKLRRLSAHLGTRTRGVVTLTGKTGLRAFKTLANLVAMIAGWIWALGTVAAGWIAWRTGRRLSSRFWTLPGPRTRL